MHFWQLTYIIRNNGESEDVSMAAHIFFVNEANYQICVDGILPDFPKLLPMLEMQIKLLQY